MPSTMCFPISGGIFLVSGDVYSGQFWPLEGVQLRLSASGAGPIFVGLPNLSGTGVTMNSGGSLSSGGLADGMEMAPGDSYLVPKSRMRITTSGISNGSGAWQAGIQDIRIHVPAASSGSRLFWEAF